MNVMLFVCCSLFHSWRKKLEGTPEVSSPHEGFIFGHWKKFQNSFGSAIEFFCFTSLFILWTHHTLKHVKKCIFLEKGTDLERNWEKTHSLESISPPVPALAQCCRERSPLLLVSVLLPTNVETLDKSFFKMWVLVYKIGLNTYSSCHKDFFVLQFQFFFFF